VLQIKTKFERLSNFFIWRKNRSGN